MSVAPDEDLLTPQHDPRAALQSLGLALCEALAIDVPSEQLDRAVDAALRRHGAPTRESWPHVLDDLTRSLDLRVGWQVGPQDDALAEVEPTQPVVTWQSYGWWMFDRDGSTTRVRRLPGVETPRTVKPKDVVTTTSTTWGLVESALPASVFGGPGTLSPARRLMGLLRAESDDLKLVLIYALAAGVLGLATPVAVQVLVNTVAFGAFRQPLAALALMLFVCLAIAALLRSLQRYVVELLQRRVFVRMVADLAERLPRVRLDAWDDRNGPELVNRFFDVLTVQKATSSLLLDGLSASLQALVGMLLLALYHPALLGFDVLLLFSIIALLWGFGRGAQDTAVYESKRKYLVAGWLEEIAAHPTIYKLGGGVELAVRRSDALGRAWLDARERHFDVFFRQYNGALVLQAVANTVLLAVGGWLVLERQLTIGQLVAAEFIVASVLMGFAKFSEKLETLYDLLAAVDKLGQLVDLPLERAHGWRGDAPDAAVGLRVDGLHMAWGGKPVFQDLSFQARPGEHLAIVGGDGAGKSTLADVLLGMREPTRGRVLVDTIDLREIRLDSLRRRVALVRGREVVSGTVADNVALGRPEIGPEAVREALRSVGLLERVEGLPKGIDTTLTATGAPLTGAERARMAVARAIVAQPRLVVVDGLLDHLFEPDLTAVIGALTHPEAPWTLIVLTRDATLAARFTRALRLLDGVARPLPTNAS